MVDMTFPRGRIFWGGPRPSPAGAVCGQGELAAGRRSEKRVPAGGLDLPPPAELGVRLRMSAAQARASAPGDPPSPAPGFQAASCSLFLDPSLADGPGD